MLYIYITFSLVFDDRFCDEHDLRSSRWQIMWCTWSQEPFTADYVKNMITDISWDSIGFRVFAGEPKFQQPLTAQGLGRRSRPLGPHMHGSWCEKAWLSVCTYNYIHTYTHTYTHTPHTYTTYIYHIHIIHTRIHTHIYHIHILHTNTTYKYHIHWYTDKQTNKQYVILHHITWHHSTVY